MVYPTLTTKSCLVALQALFAPSSCLTIATDYYPPTYPSDRLDDKYKGLRRNTTDPAEGEPGNIASQNVVIALSAIFMGTIGLFLLAYCCSSLQKGTQPSTSPTTPVTAAVRLSVAHTSTGARSIKDAPNVTMREFDRVAPAIRLSEYRERRASLMTATALVAITSNLIWLVIILLDSSPLRFPRLILVLYSAICLDTIELRDEVRELPCLHLYHSQCIVVCVDAGYDTCPLCKGYILHQEECKTKAEAQNASTRLDMNGGHVGVESV